MKLTVIGCSSGMPSANKAHSCYLVDTSRRKYMFDCGDGAASAMVRLAIDTASIEDVFISHTHPDHITGIFMFLQMEYLNNRAEPLRIHVPSEIRELFEPILRGFYLFPEKMRFEIEIVPVSDGFEYDNGDLVIRFYQNSHLRSQAGFVGLSGNKNRMECFSTVIADGETKVVYGADIGAIQDLEPLIDKSDLVITEGLHIDLSVLPGFLIEHDVKSCLLTHMPDDFDLKAVKTSFEKSGFPNVQFAAEGLQIEVRG